MDERQPAGAARVESYLTALTRTSKTPGIQYVVVTATGVLFEYTGGWADVRREVPVDAATTMMAYSMSKTLTAVAVLQLVEAGKVGLDEPVDRYLDSFPYGSKVTGAGPTSPRCDFCLETSHTPLETVQGTPVEMTLGWHVGDLDSTRLFYKEGGGKIRLQPANRTMEPRIVDADRCKVQGVVIGVLRSYN